MSQRYCKAYRLEELRRYSGWRENRVHSRRRAETDVDESEVEETGDAIVFLHQDFTVTRSMWPEENVIFDEINAAWKEYCMKSLDFQVPADVIQADSTH